MTKDDPGRPIDRPASTGRPKALDASALAALLFDEPGAAMVADVIAEGAAISTVNLSEVAKILINRDVDPGRLLPTICDQVTVEPFSLADALCAASLYPQTAHAGLSLGDRACLALAKRLNAVAVTAEHAWAQISVGVEVQLIREFHAPDR
jgi:ribonuclease VapC